MALNLETKTMLLLDIQEKHEDIITQVQSDTNTRYLDVNIYNNGIPLDLSGKTVKIYAKKDGVFDVWQDGQVTNAADGRCQFLFTKKILSEIGEVRLQIGIFQGNDRILTTQEFRMVVAENLLSSSTVQSSNEYGTLVVLFQNLKQALDLMTKMVDEIGTSGSVSQSIPVSTVWQMLEKIYIMNKQATEQVDVTEVLNRIGTKEDSGRVQTVFGRTKNIGYLKNKDGQHFASVFSFNKPKLEQIDFKNINFGNTSTVASSMCIDGDDLIMTKGTTFCRCKLYDFSIIEFINFANFENDYVSFLVSDVDFWYAITIFRKIIKIDNKLKVIVSVLNFKNNSPYDTLVVIKNMIFYCNVTVEQFIFIDKNDMSYITSDFLSFSPRCATSYGDILCVVCKDKEDTSLINIVTFEYNINNVKKPKIKNYITIDLGENFFPSNVVHKGNYYYVTLQLYNPNRIKILKINSSSLEIVEENTIDDVYLWNYFLSTNFFDGKNIYILGADTQKNKYVYQIPVENPNRFLKTNQLTLEEETCMKVMHDNAGHAILYDLTNTTISKIYKFGETQIQAATLKGYEGVDL